MLEMRIREHVLLGTQSVTVSATAKTDLSREELFTEAARALLFRYQEEFGREAVEAMLRAWLTQGVPNTEWRLRPEDSCWETMRGNGQRRT